MGFNCYIAIESKTLENMARKIKQYTNKGLTILELATRAVKGDKLKLVADYTFGMRHDKFKTATLKDPYYIFCSEKLEYNKGVVYVLIKDINDKKYSIICENEQIIGFEIEN